MLQILNPESQECFPDIFFLGPLRKRDRRERQTERVIVGFY